MNFVVVPRKQRRFPIHVCEFSLGCTVHGLRCQLILCILPVMYMQLANEQSTMALRSVSMSVPCAYLTRLGEERETKQVGRWHCTVRSSRP